jgi:branched-chain amino acid transport system permease protein
MQQVSQSVVLGVAQGALDALLALGIVLIYRTTGVLNFAQSGTGMLSAFTVYSVAQGRPLWIGVSAGLMVAAATGVATFGLVSGIKTRQFALSAAVATLAVGILLQYIIRVGWGTTSGIFPNPFGFNVWTVGDVTIAYSSLAGVVTAILLAIGLGSFLRLTRIGTMLRAIADNPEAARLCGGNNTVLIAGIWAASGMLAGVAAFFAADIVFAPSFLDTYFVAALIASVLGGLRNLVGAFVGAIALEIARNLFTVYASASIVGYTQTFVILLLIVVLVFAPRHLLAGSEGRMV